MDENNQEKSASELAREKRLLSKVAAVLLVKGCIDGLIVMVAMFCIFSMDNVTSIMAMACAALFFVRFCKNWIGHFNALHRLQDVMKKLEKA